MDTLVIAAQRSTEGLGAFRSARAPAFDRLDAYDLALRALEGKYPVLDPDSSAFDEEIMLGVYEWMRSLVRQGADPVLALTTATFDLLGPARAH